MASLNMFNSIMSSHQAAAAAAAAAVIGNPVMSSQNGVGVPNGMVNAVGAVASNAVHDDMTRCRFCNYVGADVRVLGCGCSLHARCIPLQSPGPLAQCPHCKNLATGLTLYPMSFRDIDEARKTAAALAGRNKRSRKRKSPEDVLSDPSAALSGDKNDNGDRRTGRWTSEETSYVDKLIAKFEAGQLPILDGIKLNDFLANMLKSKQSRLTKKMKNAKLSARSFKRTTGCIPDQNEAKEFSDLEEGFFHSIQCQLERAEIKFHMQKEWRELFSSFCVTIGQPLDADGWLSSVEEMDRRDSMAKDAARMARRKLMMGNALRQDGNNPDRGVFIDRGMIDTNVTQQVVSSNSQSHQIPNVVSGGGSYPHHQENEDLLSLLADKSIFNDPSAVTSSDALSRQNSHKTKPPTSTSSAPNASPFLDKIMIYLKRHNVPFEHIDAWVPSFVPHKPDDVNPNQQPPSQPSCRLCYAGCVTSDTSIGLNRQPQPLTAEDHFNLAAFGDYSQKFSFDVGCGLPGRVYQSGVPTWEQSVQNAPLHHFERCGGAVQWGVKTVVGIPVPSPNVGRIVVTLYSRFDREKDQELVGRLCDEFTRLMPSPKWKLVVDVGIPSPPLIQNNPNNNRTNLPPNPQQHPQNIPPQANTITFSTPPTQNQPKPQQQQQQQLQQPQRDTRINDIVSLLGQHMPSDPSSPLASYVPGFISIRLMMLKPSLNDHEGELVRTLLDSYSSYTASGRSRSDIAVLLARDCMFLSQQQQQQQPPPVPQQQHVVYQSQPMFQSGGMGRLAPSSNANAGMNNSPNLGAQMMPQPGRNGDQQQQGGGNQGGLMGVVSNNHNWHGN